MSALLELDSLSVTLDTAGGRARAVRDVDLRLSRGEAIGIVGESGCGKSMTALAIMGLLPENAQASGALRLEGRDLLTLTEDAWCGIRGNRLAMIFQEPMSSLNPLHTVGRQITESLSLHRKLDPRAARAEGLRLLELVGIPDPARRIDQYPHQFSGGQRQRVMIAIALANDPDVLIADEPTTALDVTIQKQILELIARLVRERGMSLVLISHNLGVIASAVSRVHVMYGGAIVESGPTRALFETLAHPYTQGLLSGIPRLGRRARGEAWRLKAIPGTVPELADLPEGCTFAGRCPIATPECARSVPPPVEISPGHRVACLHLDRARDVWRGAARA